MAERKKKQYRSFQGFVKFPPNENEVEVRGEDVTIRSFVFRASGVKEQAIDVRATLWPSHEHVEVEEGDFVAVEGSFDVNKGKDKEGEPVTYFNLSVTRIKNFGPGDAGVRDDDDEEERPRRKKSRAASSDDTGSEDEPW